MHSNKYDEEHFRKIRDSLGVWLPTTRPWGWRWTKIIRKYKQSGHLLDIGCGEGHFLEYAQRHYDTTGMDISDYCIQEAVRRASKSRLLVGSITHIGCDSESFDFVTCFDVLEHLKSPDPAVLECRRVLKSGGIFVVRIPNKSSPGCERKKEKWFAYKDKTHISLLSNKEWFDILKRYDFEILEVFYDGLWDTPYFNNIPKFLQDMFIKFPSLILFFFGIKFTQRFGENLCIIARKN